MIDNFTKKTASNDIIVIIQHEIKKLEEWELAFPFWESPIRIIDQLKKIPRTGKFLRLSAMDPKIPIRSVYDHIWSCANTASIFLPFLSMEINLDELTKFIVYHDINEVFLGDVPSYSSAFLSNNHMQRKCFVETSEKAHYIANQFLMLFADDYIKKGLSIWNEQNASAEVIKFFALTDDVDPIINVWRYIHTFPNRLDGSNYVIVMEDFFKNPVLRKHINNFPWIESILDFLTNMEYANDYLSGKTLFEFEAYTSILDVLQLLIEKKNLFYQ